MVNEKVPVWRHQVSLFDREELNVNGVISLGSYDEKEVVMETQMGMMMIRGESMNVKQLNLEDGKITIEGEIKGISYEETRQARRGLLDRFLK